MVRAHLSTLASDLQYASHPGLGKQPCPGRLACHPLLICPRLAPRRWTIPPTYDHWYLDGHFLLVVWQRGVNRCWLRGKAGRSLLHKSNGVASEYAAQQYARSERH